MDDELRPAVLKFRHKGKDRVLFFESHHDAFDVAFELDCKWDMFVPEMIAAGDIPEEFKPRKANRPLNGAVIRQFYAGGTVNVGDVVYIASDGDVEQADATSR